MTFAISFKLLPNTPSKETFDAADIPNKDAAIEAGGDLLNFAFDTADEMARKVAALEEAVQVSISGHWNDGVAPKAGWAANVLTVSVGQIYNPAQE